MASTQTKVQNRIVVGVDLADSVNDALGEAMRLTKQLPDSELHITYVIRAERGMHDAERLASMAEELRTKRDALRALVTKVCAPLGGGAPFSVESVLHVRLGDPAKALHQVAVDVDADLIVVGTHGRKGVERLMLGSVAEQLVRDARVPVLIAHPKDFTGLAFSDHLRMDPARPGEDLHATGLSDRTRLEFLPRNSHISGLL